MPLELRRNSDFNADRVNFSGFLISGTASAGTTTDIDYQLPGERLIYGGQVILSGHVFDDWMTFQVVDVDNILGYGANTVLGEYIPSWGVASDTQIQPAVHTDYPTKVASGLYIRIKYTSTGGDPVKVKVNIHAVVNKT